MLHFKVGDIHALAGEHRDNFRLALLVHIDGQDFARSAGRHAQPFQRSQGLVQVAASDMHDAVARPPGAREAFAALDGDAPGGERLAAWLTEEVPAALLAGGEIPARPATAV